MEGYIYLFRYWILAALIACSLGACPGAFDCQDTQIPCVPLDFKCDGEADCLNGRDERPSICNPPVTETELSSTIPVTCPKDRYLCEGTAECIMRIHVCNGHVECPRGDDERECSSSTCYEDEFRCEASGQCVPKSWECDGAMDCKEGTDEDSLRCADKVCPAGRKRCDNGTLAECVRESFWCDGEPECSNGADEANCPGGVRCNPGFLRCGDNSTCYHHLDRCDGVIQCTAEGDGSDEKNCPVTTPRPTECGRSESLCHDRSKCYLSDHRCDGDYDCDDMSDEVGCQCSADKFKCAVVHQCIPFASRCNTYLDCFDESDELGCPISGVQCKAGEFACNKSTQCVSMDDVCNGKKDCSAGEDEVGCVRDACGVDSPCDHCTTVHGHAKCVCPSTHFLDGYKCIKNCPAGHEYKNEMKRCVDINECETHGRCSQLCENTQGGYKCSCSSAEGYVLVNGSFCRAATGNAPRLLYANRNNLRSVELVGSPSFHPADHDQLVEGQDIVWVTFDARRSLVYYTEALTESVKCVTLSGEPKGEWRVSTHSPGGLAYDWIHGNMYVSDGLDRVIRVVNVNDTSPDSVVDLYDGKRDGFKETRALVVYPKRAWIFFSDWQSNTIFRGGMDGGKLKMIYNQKSSWANGLAIDLVNERLYWADAGLKGIFSSDLEGGHLVQVISPTSKIFSPFGLALFEDTMFWSDRNKTRIYTANKFKKGADIKELSNVLQPLGVTVFHPSLQPAYPNLCAEHTCRHMCLPSPLSPDALRVVSYSCRCHRGFVASVDNPHDCVPSLSVLSPQDAGGNAGMVAGVASGVALVVLLVVLMVGVCFYRYQRGKGSRSMNFDNPVYHKTTAPSAGGHIPEDRLRLPDHEQPPALVSNVMV